MLFRLPAHLDVSPCCVSGTDPEARDRSYAPDVMIGSFPYMVGAVWAKRALDIMGSRSEPAAAPDPVGACTHVSGTRANRVRLEQTVSIGFERRTLRIGD